MSAAGKKVLLSASGGISPFLKGKKHEWKIC
jgi:hypothetical protein